MAGGAPGNQQWPDALLKRESRLSSCRLTEQRQYTDDENTERYLHTGVTCHAMDLPALQRPLIRYCGGCQQTVKVTVANVAGFRQASNVGN